MVDYMEILRLSSDPKNSQRCIASIAYAGLKVHPDRASWCIADGEMVHRHR